MTGTPADPPLQAEEPRLVGADRVLAVLKELARFPNGVGLDELTRAVGSPKPTVHRALGALRRAGFADQDAPGRYVLGDEVLRMAFSHHDARPEHTRVRPVLDALAERFNETVHYAVLDGREVVYRGKVDPPSGAVRLTSTIGGRNPAHATGVGKLLLSYRLGTLEQVVSWMAAAEPERRTPHTLCAAEELHHDLELTRARGFALDDEENEVGVNCIAFPVFSASRSLPAGAISVSAMRFRTPLSDLVAAAEDVRAIVAPLGPDR